MFIFWKSWMHPPERLHWIELFSVSFIRVNQIFVLSSRLFKTPKWAQSCMIYLLYDWSLNHHDSSLLPFSQKLSVSAVFAAAGIPSSSFPSDPPLEQEQIAKETTGPSVYSCCPQTGPAQLHWVVYYRCRIQFPFPNKGRYSLISCSWAERKETDSCAAPVHSPRPSSPRTPPDHEAPPESIQHTESPFSWVVELSSVGRSFAVLGRSNFDWTYPWATKCYARFAVASCCPSDPRCRHLWPPPT